MREKHIEEIRETKNQIYKTQSKERKRQLLRHLRKLQKELKIYDFNKRSEMR